MHGRTEAIPRGSLTKDHRCPGAGGGRRFGNPRNTGAATGRYQRAIRALRRWSRSARAIGAGDLDPRAGRRIGPAHLPNAVVDLDAAAALHDRLGRGRRSGPRSRPARRLSCGSAVSPLCVPAKRRRDRAPSITDSTTKPTTCNCHGQSISSALIPIRIAAMPNQRKKKPGSRTSTPSRTRPSTHQDQPPSAR